MNIIEIKKIEDCFDGSSVYAYIFDKVWTRDTIMRLRMLGQVDYFPDFPRPFFRLCGQEGMQVKGIEGENTCRIIFPKKRKEIIRQEFERHINTSF